MGQATCGGVSTTGRRAWDVIDAGPAEAASWQLQWILLAGGLLGALIAVLGWSAFVGTQAGERAQVGAVAFGAESLLVAGVVQLIRIWLRQDLAGVEHVRAVMRLEREVEAQQAHHEELELERRAAVEASAAKSRFLARTSHELRTPLHAVLGFGQLLGLGALSSGQRECVDQVVAAGRHLLRLIDEVLDISRIESGALGITVEPVPVDTVVHEVVAMLAPLAHTSQVVISERRSGAVVLADRLRLKQVVLNLVGNAVKYNLPAGTVDIRVLDSAAGRTRLVVADTGPGIAAADLDRLFVPFERLDTRSSWIEGSGLGLALSRSLVLAMGGEIGVTSEPGAGSTFWVELVTADAAEPFAAGRTDPPEPLPAPHAETVLYIEDDDANVRLVQRLLDLHSDVRLEVARTGNAGVAAALVQRPDAVLVDLHLPDMPGRDVVRLLRADRRTAAARIIAVSADARRESADALRLLGVDDQLPKPFEIADLLRALGISGRRTVHSPGPSADAPVRILDPTVLHMLRGLHDAAAGGPGISPLLDGFFEESARRVAAARAGLEAGDLDAVAEEAHTLVGCCAGFAAAGAAAASRALHAAAAAGDPTAAGAAAAELERSLAVARRALLAELLPAPVVP